MLKKTIGSLTAAMLMAPEGEPNSGGAADPVPPKPPEVEPKNDPAQANPGGNQGAQPLPENKGGSNEKIHSLHTADFKRIKEESAQKGAKRALEDLAKRNGFTTPEEVEKFIASAREQIKKHEEALANPPPPPGSSEAEKRAHQLQSELEAEKKQRQVAQRKAKQAEEELNAFRARAELREKALMKGAIDAEFVVHLIEKGMAAAAAGKSGEAAEAALAQFDEDKFIDELKASRPHIFGAAPVQPKPATTGPGSGSPPPPKPKDVQEQLNGDSATDAMKLSQAEFQKKYFSSTEA